MKKVLLGILISSFVFVVFQYIELKKEKKEQLNASTALIQQQIKNVGKLIVTEGNFSQVFTYKDSKKIYFDIFSSEKKAIVIVNATVSVSYDLSKITTEIFPEKKEVLISNLPDPEIKINPNIEYYDLQQDYLNEFVAEDYNKIKKRVKKSLLVEIENSDLKKRAKNSLLFELQKLYILTNSMGWMLRYNEQEVNLKGDFQQYENLLD